MKVRQDLFSVHIVHSEEASLERVGRVWDFLMYICVIQLGLYIIPDFFSLECIFMLLSDLGSSSRFPHSVSSVFLIECIFMLLSYLGSRGFC